MINSKLVNILKSGGVAVVRTDTLYGLLASADDEQAVRRVYEIKGRDDNKPPIVLIADMTQLYNQPDNRAADLLQQVWPGKVSVIIPSETAPSWVTRGGHTVAYRLPDNEALRELLRQTGPLIAPSANPQGRQPAANIEQAQSYFGDSVDYYEDGGEVTNAAQPSQLLRILDDGSVERLR